MLIHPPFQRTTISVLIDETHAWFFLQCLQDNYCAYLPTAGLSRLTRLREDTWTAGGHLFVEHFEATFHRVDRFDLAVYRHNLHAARPAIAPSEIYTVLT